MYTSLSFPLGTLNASSLSVDPFPAPRNGSLS